MPDYLRITRQREYHENMLVARAMTAYGMTHAVILEYRRAYDNAVFCAVRVRRPYLWHKRMQSLIQVLVDAIKPQCQDPEHAIRATLTLLDMPLNRYYMVAIEQTATKLEKLHHGR